MINGNLNQFLDTGWYSEATLYYYGYTYWCEAQWNNDGIAHFFVYKYPSLNVNNEYSLTIIENDGSSTYKDVFDMAYPDIDYIKKLFLEARIFDDKSFWDVESEIAWLDDEGNIFRRDIPEYLSAVSCNDKTKMVEIKNRCMKLGKK